MNGWIKEQINTLEFKSQMLKSLTSSEKDGKGFLFHKLFDFLSSMKEMHYSFLVLLNSTRELARKQNTRQKMIRSKWVSVPTATHSAS